MDIVAAVELVRAILFFVNLNLNAVVVKVVLLAQHSVSCLEDGLLLACAIRVHSQMAGEGVLVVAERPHVDVMNFFNSIDVVKALLDPLDIKMVRDSLKDQNDTLPEGEASSVKHDESEDISAERVDKRGILTNEEDYERGNDNAYRVKDVADDVEEGCSNVNILLVLVSN